MKTLDSVHSTSRAAAKWTLKNTCYKDVQYREGREFNAADKPFLIRFDATSACNLACKKCFYPAYAASGAAKNFMPLEDFRTIASKVFDYTYAIQLACRFESFIHPEFAEMVRIADSYAIPHMGVVTNGTMLNGDRAQAILDANHFLVLSVSVDGVRPETFHALRGRPVLDRVLGNIEEFLQERRRRGKSRPALKVNTIIMRSNMEELPEILAWCVEKGVDEAQFIQVGPFDKTNDEAVIHDPEGWNRVRARLAEMSLSSRVRVFLPPPLTPEYFDWNAQRYRWDHGLEDLKAEGDTSYSGHSDPLASHPYPGGVFCICPWMTLMIDSWGDVTPCIHRTNDKPYGNLIHQSLDEAINGIRLLRIRKGMVQGRKEKVCPSCQALWPSSDPLRRKITRVLPREDPSSS